MSHRFIALAAAAMLALLPVPADAQGTPRALRTRNVILVMTDGLRWQELFGGAQAAYIGPAGSVSDTLSLQREFMRDTPQARRRALLPFVWDSIAANGQIFGDSASGSIARITNTFKFSYPGYNETFTGFADPRIDSNGHPANANTTVFEWLNRQRGFQGRVDAYATWDAFSRIINRDRSGIPVHDGWDPARAVANSGTARATVLRDLYASSARLWRDNAWDALMHQSMLDGVVTRKPRVLFIGYGETDEWAHAGRYDMYLRSARQVDAYLAELWSTLQRDPQYRGSTTLVVTTDHGRGTGREWRDHGEQVVGAERIWMAVMGPDTPALGVRANTPVQQAQVAATIAALLGKDWTKQEARAAGPLPVLR